MSRIGIGRRAMPKGPRGEKRPADAVGLAVLVGRIAVGDVEDTAAVDRPEARKAAAKTAAVARARKLTATERSKIASKAARTRWEKGPAAPGKTEPT